VGIVSVPEALEYADRLNLDLVEVAPMANPPVCKVMDFGKYRYEQEQKAKEARKHQTTISIKEIKLRPKIDDHDFDTKKGHVERFLKKGDKVKLTIMFRGRELVHPHLGERLLRRMAEDLAEIGEVESEPNLDGRNMIMMLAPKRS
jgi:translation initiation factor IF-3